MPEVLIFYGAPGSGKTTFRNTIPHDLVINTDTIRKEMPDAKPAAHWATAYKMLEIGVEKGLDRIIVDNTNIHNDSINKLITIVRNTEANRKPQYRKASAETNDAKPATLSPYEIILVYFDIPLDVILARNAQRTGREFVPEKIVRDYANAMVPLSQMARKFRNLDGIMKVDFRGRMSRVN